jgi:hypothetical protein
MSDPGVPELSMNNASLNLNISLSLAMPALPMKILTS